MGEIFIEKIERKKTARECFNEELRGDLELFRGKNRELVEKYLWREAVIGLEMRVLDRLLNKWWGDKYGFPRSLKSARDELLLMKYGEIKDLRKAKELEMALMRAIKSNDGGAISRIKTEYVESYPDQLEGVEILLGLKNYLDVQNKLNAARKHNYKREKEDFVDLTEYRFLLMHFILQNSGDEEFVRTFWEVLGGIADSSGGRRLFNQLQISTLIQVAVHRILEKLGK